MYTFYCDTNNPPTTLLFSSDYGRDRIPLEKRLLPNHTYYWKCVVTNSGFESSSDIYSFTTVDLSSLYNKIWDLNYTLTKEVYEHFDEDNYHHFDEDTLIFGDYTRFQPIGDSVFMVKRYAKWGADFYPVKETFKCTSDSIFLGERHFRFVNYGYSDSYRAENNRLYLVIERPFDHIIFIYAESESYSIYRN
jgi:hypothetical protein